MNKKSKIIIASLLAFCVAGTGTAVAMATIGASKDVPDTPIDSAIYLDWGECDVADIESLTDTTPAYRKVVCLAPVKSASVSADSKFSFHLTADEGEGKTLAGVSVSIASAEWKEGMDPEKILAEKQTTWTSPALTADTTYFLKVEVSSEEYAKYAAGTQTMAGVMTLSYKVA